MSVKHSAGVTPFDRLVTHYDDRARICPKCGSDRGTWRGETDGCEIHYEHVCPACDAVSERSIRLC
jgi:hypothetical protein